MSDSPAGRRGSQRAPTAAPVRSFASRLRRGMLALGMFTVTAWLTLATIGYLGARHLLAEQAKTIDALELAHDAALRGSAETDDLIVRLKQEAALRDEVLAELVIVRASLERRLLSERRRLAAVTEQRDSTQRLLDEIGDGLEASNSRLAGVLKERYDLTSRVRNLAVRVDDVTRQRDATRRRSEALRWQVARLESELADADQDKTFAQIWFKDWLLGNVEALQELFLDTGIDLDTLIRRASMGETGVGGPVDRFDPADGAADLGAGDAVSGQIHRLHALQKLANAMPLAAPVEHFHVTSSYGKRRDPFTRRWAFHSGLDLGAGRDAEILAAAPGIVTFAGDNGPYGNMIEIDHGMGVTTRYGHLERIDVEIMDQIELRQSIGIIGSTGRSTARHLHYEVRIDGEAYNPAKFIEAGRYLDQLFDFRHSHFPPVGIGGPPPPKPQA